MANKKYKLDGNDYWEASGVYDIGQGDTQRNINDEVATKLATIAEGAEVNQNAFSNVTVGGTTIAADSKTDTLTLTAGSNITLTPNATNDSVTIAANDTTYDNATQSAAGLMSAADKTKLDTLDSADITDNSTVGGSTVEASLTSLKGSLNTKLPVYNTTTSSGDGIPTDAEILSSLSLGGLSESFLVNFKLSNDRIAFVVIWEKLWTNLASGIGFGYYDSYKTIVKYNVSSGTLRKYKPDAEIDANATYINRLMYNTAPVEITNIASKAYNIGEFVVVSGVLYRVISAISNGDTFTVNTNIVLDTIANHLPIVQDVQLDLSDMASNITNRNTYCKKFGNMIFLAIDVEVTGSTSSSMGAVLPQGSRPSQQISTALGNGLSTGVVSIVIRTDGRIFLYPQGSGYCQGVVTFLTN